MSQQQLKADSKHTDLNDQENLDDQTDDENDWWVFPTNSAICDFFFANNIVQKICQHSLYQQRN